PEEDLVPLVKYYWRLGFNDPEIASQCLDHFNRVEFSLRLVQKRTHTLGLLGSRQQGATAEAILPFYHEIRTRFPTMGARAMVATLRQQYNFKVSERFLGRFLKDIEPEEVHRRLGKHFKRKRFWAAGVMDIIAFDQHDKWGRFGLWFHLGMDPFPGRIMWLKVWWTNRNPKLVTSYYIKATRAAGGISLITQSDLGSENYGIANCHTQTRHRLDPSLEGTLQHRWLGETHNIKPESTWSQMRRQFTPGFENILDSGVARGLYNVNRPLEKLVFRWLAIPWLQAELDSWVERYNSTPRRRDKNKILPHGIPDMINAKPELFGTKDYKVLVPPALFDEMEQKWAPPDDPVFLLTPPVFAAKIQQLYRNLGQPTVTSYNFWDIYVALLDHIVLVEEELTLDIQNLDDAFEAPIDLIPCKELRHGENAVAGYGNQGGSSTGSLTYDDDEEDLRLYADLTDPESDS
ncbi:hypothetical protein B0H15DRAFT_792147, partial [Mycena belliarum]